MHALLPTPEPPELSLDELYRTHVRQVARWAQRLGAPEAEVDDVVHEVFLVAKEKLPEFRGEARLTTWLYRITERVALAHRRRHRSACPEALSRLIDPRPGPEELLAGAELRSAVQKTLDELPSQGREVLELGLLSELSASEVASRLSVSEGAVWVRGHRARKLFRERFLRRFPGLSSLLAIVFALLLLSAGATALARWMKASTPKSTPAPAPVLKPQARSHRPPPARTEVEPSPETTMKIAFAPLLITTTLWTSPAMAAEPEPEKVIYAKKTLVDFSELRLTGHVEGPEASFVTVRQRSRFECLVRARGDFLPEISSSVDRL